MVCQREFSHAASLTQALRSYRYSPQSMAYCSSIPPTSLTRVCASYFPPRILLPLTRRSTVCSLHPRISAICLRLWSGCFAHASSTISRVMSPLFLRETFSAIMRGISESLKQRMSAILMARMDRVSISSHVPRSRGAAYFSNRKTTCRARTFSQHGKGATIR